MMKAVDAGRVQRMLGVNPEWECNMVERVRLYRTAKSDAGDAPAQPGKVPWPADRIERWPIDRLVPYARNARTHTPAQIDQIAASIREWGLTMPILVDEDGMILAGHARVLAAQKLRLADVPVIVARGWSEAKKRAYVIADNKLTLNSAWDEELLRIELADLKLQDFDMALLGFDDSELNRILAERSTGATDPDDAPEKPPILCPVPEIYGGWDRIISYFAATPRTRMMLPGCSGVPRRI
jgi:hypothetical protein